MDDYTDVKELLKPRRDITASDRLRMKVNRALEKTDRKLLIRKWIFGGISLSAIAAVLLLVL